MIFEQGSKPFYVRLEEKKDSKNKILWIDSSKDIAISIAKNLKKIPHILILVR